MKKIFFCLYFLILYFSLQGKSSYINLTTDQGLASNTINCIYKDKIGFTWIGTATGLNRFDGIEIYNFDDFREKSVLDITQQDSCHLFILSEKELYLYDLVSRKNRIVEVTEKKNDVFKKFTLDNHGNLYIISQTSLFFLPQKETRAYKIKNLKIAESTFLSDALIVNDQCWITSSKGLIQYDLKTRHSTFYKNGEDSNFLCITTEKNNLFIGTRNGNILSFNHQSGIFSEIKSFGNIYIQRIFIYQNKLYIGTNGSGLKIVDLKHPGYPLPENNLFININSNSNTIYSIFVDSHAFWIGTFSGGISCITSNPTSFEVFNSKKDFAGEPNIRSFFVDNNGNGIYGTRNGLICNLGAKPILYTTENTPALKSNIILCVYPISQFIYLAGTYNGGLYILNSKTKKISRFNAEPIFCENSFYSIVQNEQNVIWFGTLAGLVRYDIIKKTHTVFNTANSGIASNDIYSLLSDSSGRIWIATKAGICYFKNGKIHRIEKLAARITGIVRYVYEDSKKNIWLGTETQGAISISRNLNSIHKYSSQNILPDNYVSSIIEDKEGQIWITTHKGILRLKSNSEYVIFSLYDGLPSYTFNDGAIQKTSDNTIWWGCEKGLVRLNISSLKKRSPAKLHLTKVIIGGMSEDVKLNNLHSAPEYLDTIELPRYEKNLIFRFSDFKYDFPPSIVYEYKLDGLSSEWQRIVASKEIVIPNIPEGEYILRIREAGNDDSVKSILVKKKKSYSIYLLFLAIMICIATASIYYKRYAKEKNSRQSALQGGQNYEKSDKVKYQNAKLDNDELETIKHAIIKYMDDVKPYLNPDFKLDDMATEINCSKSKISQVLNIHLDTNFSNLVSRYRIQTFKEKAKAGLLVQYTLSALARECGFSSRSSFFYTVKKLTGQTPAEFLKEAGISIDNWPR